MCMEWKGTFPILKKGLRRTSNVRAGKDTNFMDEFYL